MALERTPENKKENRELLSNPYLDLSEDILYHLGLSTSTHDLPKMFGDVKFVCMGGTAARMQNLAGHIFNALGNEMLDGTKSLPNICERTERYAMFKAGPVLCVSHGIGSPSLLVVLHEVYKMLHYAGAEDVIFLRVGSCGGIGLEPGTIVITSECLNGRLQPYDEITVLGRIAQRPSHLNQEVAQELKHVAEQYFPAVPVAVGKTMCADDFYEGQGRMDGAICEYNNEERAAFLHRLKTEGVVNIEMECVSFGAFCTRVGLKAGIVCFSLIDRTKGDQVCSSKSCMLEWEERLVRLIALFIKEKIQIE